VSGPASFAARTRPVMGRLRRPSLPALTPRLGRRLLVALVAALVLLATYLLWFRDSSLVKVEQVSVTGATSADAGRMRAALTSVARDMTTLHVDRERLERAVAGYPVVQGLEVSTDFPHGMTIRVVEHRPAAWALTGGARVAVAADGTVLRGLPIDGPLPTIRARAELDGDRLANPVALSAARVAGAAPDALRRRVEDVSRTSDKGLVAQLREGPEIVFGGATRLRAKWAAAARVLADPDAAGASYVDVRLPDRPAAGGLGTETVAPADPAPMEPAAPVDPTATPVDPTTAAPLDPTAAAPTDPNAAAADPNAAAAPQPASAAPLQDTTQAPSTDTQP
jgi:cell division protein FtsQ